MSTNIELMPRTQDRRILHGRSAEASALGRPLERWSGRSRPEESDWQRAAAILRKYQRSSILASAAIVLIVAVWTFAMKSVYEPEGSLQIDPPGSEVFSLENGGHFSGDTDYIGTEAQKLQTDELALAVIHNLKLDQTQEFAGALSARTEDRPASAEGAGVRLTPAENAALKTFHGRLQVQRAAGSRLVTIKFASHSPELAAKVVNTLMNLFVQQSYQARHEAIMQSSQWLARQLDDIRERMEQSNLALADFQKRYGIADVGEKSNTFADQVADLNKQYAQAQADRIQLQAFLNRVRRGSPESLPQVSTNPVVQALTQRLAEVRSQASEARVIYGVNHPNVMKLENQARELENALNTQKESIFVELQTSYAAAQAREALLSRQVRGATRALTQMAQYNSLKKDSLANAELYNNLYAKIKEAGIAAASKSSNVRVVDLARVLDHPTRPRVKLNLAVGLFAGLLGGIVLAFVREGMEDKISTPEDIRKWLGLSAVTIVPVMDAQVRSSILLPLARPRLGTAGRFLLERPESPQAEALRSLRTSVLLSSPERPPQVLLVVSPLAGEGKTTVATNLAIALARQGRTCLVDADLRNPSVAGHFGLQVEQGLGSVLRGSACLEQVLLAAPDVPNLTLLPGDLEGENAAQLCCSDSARDLVVRLREHFDFVIIDTPPLLPYADGRALSPLADAVILVGRAGTTPRQAMSRSMELLDEVHAAPVLEIVLNAADLKASGYAYYYKNYR